MSDLYRRCVAYANNLGIMELGKKFVVLKDDGNGVSIYEWNLQIPRPSREQLDAIILDVAEKKSSIDEQIKMILTRLDKLEMTEKK